jgi:hypothetical protein
MNYTQTLKNFIPLIVIFAIIIAYTGFMVFYHHSWDALFVMRHFEGAFFIIFGVFKLLNWKGFVDAYRTYDIVAKRSQLYAYAYPLIEIALGLAYLFSFHLLTTSVITLLLMIVGSIGVAKALAHKRQIQCACLGVVFKIPMTKVTLIEDILMGGMALLMILWLT